jgi:acetyltransferase-like isoleucine patch superfamily enzyme
MLDATPIVVPLENVNDPSVKLLSWLVKSGDEVREGQLIAEMETSKAVVELAAPAAGRITMSAAAGEDLAVGTVIGFIGRSMNGIAAVANPERPPASLPPAIPGLEPSSVPGVRFSKKALELMQRNQLPAAAFERFTMVREQDVLDYVNGAPSPQKAAAALPFALRDVSLHGVTLPAGLGDTSHGNLDPDFLDYLGKNTQSFARLSSEEKCREYRDHGASIGAGVVLGAETVIVSPRIVLGDGVEIGNGGSIHCREAFVVGPLSSFRAGLQVRGGLVHFGENVYAGSRIQIGGGGNADPWALLCVGDNAYLGDDLFLNVCRAIVIGSEVFLTQRAILVTHNIGHSILEGYENCFEPIVLEDKSQVGMGSTLYAGVRIGRSAIVASNSYVISSIPEGKLAMGVPAKVVRDAVRKLDRTQQVRIAKQMILDFRELLHLKGALVSQVVDDSFTLTQDGRTVDFAFMEVYRGANTSADAVFWTFATETAPHNGASVFNLLGKNVQGPGGLFEDSAREFLRKRGIRFQPGPWRYRRGLV